MWRQVRGERGRERGREDVRRRRCSATDGVRRLRAGVVAAARRRRRCSAGCATPSSSPGSAEGVLDAEEQRAARRSPWAATEPDAVGRGRRRCSTSCATRSATCPRRRARRPRRRPRPAGDLFDDERAGADHGRRARVRPTGAAWTPPTHRIEDDGYAHVLVDEAQDLTPMQWRMVGRRGRAATWTIVGDPAQSSWPVPAEAAAARAEALGRQGRGTTSTSRRTTATARRSTTSPRRTPSGSASTPTCRTPCARPVSSPRERTVVDLGGRSATRVTELAGAVEGTVGIVVPVARRGEVQGWLDGWPELAEAASGGACARLAVLTGLDTKGLEFDGIVVVAPDEIEAESADRPARSTSCSPAPPSGWSPSPPEPSRRERTSGWCRVGANARLDGAESARTQVMPAGSRRHSVRSRRLDRRETCVRADSTGPFRAFAPTRPG